MRKHFLLALPLASMAFLAGCSCGTGDCAPVVDDCNTCPATTTMTATVTAAPAQYAVAEAAEVVYAEGAEIRHFGGGRRYHGGHRYHGGRRYHGGEYSHYNHGVIQGMEHGAGSVVDAGIHGVEAVGHGVGNVIHGVEHGVGNVFHGIGNALHITDAQGAAQQMGTGEVMSADQYMALIKSGKVQDTSYRAPGYGSTGASVEATEVMASIPSRFQPIAPVAASVSVEVATAAPLPMPTVAAASYDDDMTVAATEMPITNAELTTPALMNAAALREANIVSAAVSVETSAPAGVGRIPAMPLPEGWGYIHEQDLGANSVEATGDDQYFSDARSLVGGGKADDI